MIEIQNEDEMQAFGMRIGSIVQSGDVIELVGDVGAGKTTLVRGLAKGMKIEETVQSPSFTISREYEAPDGRLLAHYDFYRLDDPGIMAQELSNSVAEKDKVVVIEWAAIVESILPGDRLTLIIRPESEDSRSVEIKAVGIAGKRLAEALA